jgi:hypothetical protein
VIAAGAVVYFFVLLKRDSKIRDELKEIGESMGLPWIQEINKKIFL